LPRGRWEGGGRGEEVAPMDLWKRQDVK